MECILPSYRFGVSLDSCSLDYSEISTEVSSLCAVEASKASCIVCVVGSDISDSS